MEEKNNLVFKAIGDIGKGMSYWKHGRLLSMKKGESGGKLFHHFKGRILLMKSRVIKDEVRTKILYSPTIYSQGIF